MKSRSLFLVSSILISLTLSCVPLWPQSSAVAATGTGDGAAVWPALTPAKPATVKTDLFTTAHPTNRGGGSASTAVQIADGSTSSGAAPTGTALQENPTDGTTHKQTIIKRGNRPIVGLALGGGGTRGLAHITVLRVLEKNGIPIDCIAGTSMGSIVGGMYASGMSTEKIEEVMRGKKFLRSYETVPIPLRLCLVPVFFVPHYVGIAFGYKPYDGLYRGNKFASYVDGSIPFAAKNIEDCRIPFHAVASNLLTGQPYTISKGDIGKACQASSAIPGLRRPLFWQDQLLVDGGVVANLPVEQCRQMGADIVIAVDVDERLEPIKDQHFRKIGSVLYRCLNMHLSAIDRSPLKEADVVIHPDVNGIQILSSKLKDMEGALVEGEKAAKEAVPAILEQINKKLASTRPEDPS